MELSKKLTSLRFSKKQLTFKSLVSTTIDETKTSASQNTDLGYVHSTL